MRKAHILWVSFVLITCVFTSQLMGKTPPLGKRLYIIDKKDPDVPVKIVPVESKNVTKAETLRDPIFPGKRDEGFVQKSDEERELAKNLEEQARRSKVQLKPLIIDGRIIKPRLTFTQKNIKQKRADEPVNVDVINRMFKTAESLDVNL